DGPGYGSGSLPRGLIELRSDDEAARAPQRAGLHLAPLGLPEVAPVQRAGDPVAGVAFQGDADVDGGVDGDDARPRSGTGAEDASELPGPVQRRLVQGVEEETG